jgi:hypothetical protein
MAMAKNGKKGPVKTGLGGQSREIGRGGSGAAGGSYGPTAGRGNLGKGVVNKLRQSGAISKAPSTADAVKAAKAELKTISGQLDKLGRVNTYKNPAVTKQYSDISKRITHIQKMMKKWS